MSKNSVLHFPPNFRYITCWRHLSRIFLKYYFTLYHEYSIIAEVPSATMLVLKCLCWVMELNAEPKWKYFIPPNRTFNCLVDNQIKQYNIKQLTYRAPQPASPVFPCVSTVPRSAAPPPRRPSTSRGTTRWWRAPLLYAALDLRLCHIIYVFKCFKGAPDNNYKKSLKTNILLPIEQIDI